MELTGYGSAINYVFVFLYSLEKNDQETTRPTTATSISHHFSSHTNQKGGDVGDRKNKRKAGPGKGHKRNL